MIPIILKNTDEVQAFQDHLKSSVKSFNVAAPEETIFGESKKIVHPRNK